MPLISSVSKNKTLCTVVVTHRLRVQHVSNAVSFVKSLHGHNTNPGDLLFTCKKKNDDHPINHTRSGQCSTDLIAKTVIYEPKQKHFSNP
jgi:hypothetical protein